MTTVLEQAGKSWIVTIYALKHASTMVVRVLSLAAAFFAGPGHAGDIATRSDLGPSELSLSGSHGMTARISQAGDLNDAILRQSGIQHAGQIDQSGTANEINAIQIGHANQFATSQAGSGNEIELTQAGRANVATVTQVGSSHRTAIEQNGNSNVVNVQQLPLSPNLLVQQHGHGLAAKVIQY
jgi:hypothetical protein